MAKLYGLIDSFNDNSRDTALWNSFGTGVAEANGRIEFTLPASTIGYMGYTSVTTWDATASEARVRVDSAGNQSLASLEVYPIILYQNASNNVNFLISGNTLRAYRRVAGVNTQLATMAYSATTHKFLRIREAAGTTYWEYSAKGATWTTLHSAANPITLTAVEVQIEAGTYGSEASGTSVHIDEFNTLYLNSGAKLPGVAYTEDVAGVTGSTIWTDPDNATLNDGSRASGNNVATMETGIVREVRAMIDGTIGSTNLANGETITGTNMVYGSAANLWGETLTPEVVENVDFGLAVCFGKDVGGTDTTETNFLVARDFDFDLPYDSSISGLEGDFETVSTNLGGGTFNMGMDVIQATLYFQWSPRIEGGGQASGLVWTERPNFRKRNKNFRHRVYTQDGQFVGEWTDVKSEPRYKHQINTPLSVMDLELARTDKVGARSVEAMLTEGDEEVLTEGDESILVTTAAESGLGAGTDLDLNLDYRLTAYYGEFVELLTEDGEPMTTESDQIVMVEDGAPAGRDLFTGYVEEWEDNIGGSETVSAHLISHSHELNNIMLETADVAVVTNTTATGEDGLSGGGPTDNTGVGQSFTMVGSVPVSRITIPMKRWGGDYPESYPKVTLTLRVATPTSPGAVVATAEAYVYDREFSDVSFIFNDYPDLTNATVYSFELTCDQNKTGGSPTYPVTFQTGTTYAGGSGYKYVAGSWAVATYDMLFKLYQAGGDTTVPYLSQDPSQMRRSILEFAKSRGARVTYDLESIEDTGTVVSYTFKSNTVAEALAKTLELAPADWYSWYDLGLNVDHFHARPTVVDKTLTVGKDIVQVGYSRTMRNIVNDVYFSGGGDPALFKRTQDSASRNQWRRALAKISDNRVVVEDTAVTMSEARIERYADPVYVGTGTIISQVNYTNDEIAGNTYLEDYLLGMLFGFNGSGSVLDDLQLQHVGYTYNPDTLDIEVGNLMPPVSKRIEDIRRNLDVLEQQNNPSAPS